MLIGSHAESFCKKDASWLGAESSVSALGRLRLFYLPANLLHSPF